MSRPDSTHGTLLDRYLVTYDVRSHHEIQVDASADLSYQAARQLDIGRSLPVSLLLAIRALPHLLTGKARLNRAITLETFLEFGFVILEENPPKEIVMGAVGRFWRPDSGMVRVAPDEFTTFDKPGFARAVLAFTVEERGSATSFLATETRVACTDPSSRRKFLLYWSAIGPFSGMIRRLMLNQAKRTAEAA